SDLDAVQDVFVVVHKKLPAFDFRHRVSTWIYAICLRVASDRRRSAAARREVQCEPALDEARAQADPDERRQLRALLAIGLDALPPEQRAVFTLFELDGKTGDEIAELLAIPTATVHSRLRLARIAFRRALERVRARERFDATKTGGLP